MCIGAAQMQWGCYSPAAEVTSNIATPASKPHPPPFLPSTAAQVIGLNTPLSQQAGYFCSVCNCVLRDSQSYLDHVNGKYHQRALGMNMNVEKSSLEQVGGWGGGACGGQLLAAGRGGRGGLGVRGRSSLEQVGLGQGGACGRQLLVAGRGLGVRGLFRVLLGVWDIPGGGGSGSGQVAACMLLCRSFTCCLHLAVQREKGNHAVSTMLLTQPLTN